jgi:diamine N-acetyltransferase
MTFRRGTASDAATLAEFAERTFRQSFANANSSENMELHCAASFGVDIQGRDLSDHQQVIQIAEESGELAGFMQLRLDRPTACIDAMLPAELHRIYVEREWQGRGVAQELMRSAAAAATRAGNDWLWLGVWEHNPKAIAFYTKYGFELVGEHPFMLGRDQQRDLIMAARTEDLSSIA